MSDNPFSTSGEQIFHTRKLFCEGSLRSNNRWNIDGNISDAKSYSFPNKWRGEIKAGELLHDMWLRLVINHKMIIEEVDLRMQGYPFSICSEVTPNFQGLVGLRITKGFRKEVLQRLGGINGCTHVLSLLDTMATTALQTIFGYMAMQQREQETSTGGFDAHKLINSCYSWAENREPAQHIMALGSKDKDTV